MNFSNYLCIAISTYIIFLGVYIFRFPDRKKIQTYFLFLSGLFSFWILTFALRQFVNSQYRHLALDWMLIPTIFFPILLDRIVSLISKENHKLPIWKTGILSILVMYFLWASFTCSYSILNNQNDFSYTSTIHYHILIGYEVGFVSYCLLKLIRSIYLFSGEQRVRFSLMFIGVFVMLSFAILFIYILPLLGIFYGPLSSIGALIFFSFWAVAILQYNAFEIKYAVLDGDKVPALTRFSLNFFLFLFKILDPVGFRNSNLQYKKTFSSDFLVTDIKLRLRTDLDHYQRSEALARRYDQFIK
ncbi:LIC10906 family membrane protein [Leptospira weilii]|uniref:LIC10906 family membrane protein n=1 Tax=Leptospira weilii TaxID=28184 RepID=UPI000773EE38|nr:hypothetical protein [Leptospira weilii]